MNKYINNNAKVKWTNNKDTSIISLIKSYIISAENGIVLVSDPQFYETNTAINITIFYYENYEKNDFMFRSIGRQNIIKITEMASKYYGKDVSINYIKIHYPYINASIFSQYLFHNSSANNFIDFQNSIMKQISWHGSSIMSHVKGIKIEVSGRIVTEKVIPRVTRKSIVFGSLSKSKYTDYSSKTQKNFLGSITIKVWIGNN